LRVKARRLLVERGMPRALTSVMGSAASGEALGRVFDCLQVQEVARGLMFALLLQALRATTQ
jgi:Sorting nexin C terminal